MLKKRLYIALSLLQFCFASNDASAQIVFDLLESNITAVSPADLNINYPSGSFTLPVVGGSIQYRSTTGTGNFTTSTSGSPNLPLNVANVKISGGTGITLLGTIRPEVVLTNSNQELYAGGVNVGTGTLNINYRIAMAGKAWTAGSYISNNAITMVTPSSPTLTINVPSFFTINTPPSTTTLTVTSLNDFRTGPGLSGNNTFNYSTSLPAVVSLSAYNTNNFSFTTTTPKIIDPSPASTLLSAAITSPVTGGSISVSSSPQVLNAIGISVPISNRQLVTTAFNINPSNLKNNFVQAGTYTLPIKYDLTKTPSAYSSATITSSTTSNIQIVVPRLFEFVVQANDILFNLNSVNAYRNGLTIAMPNPIVLSSTVPYSMSVKASGDFTLSAGNIIPIGSVTVEGTAIQTGIIAIQLSTASQTMISGASPQIDRSINLQYRIPAAAANSMIGKAAGTYQNTITFTLTAP